MPSWAKKKKVGGKGGEKGGGGGSSFDFKGERGNSYGNEEANVW